MHNVHGHAADAAASDRKKFRRSSSEKAQWFENYKIGIFIVFVYKIFGTKIQLILARNMLQISFCFYFPSLYSLCFSLHKCKQFAKASVTNNLDDALFSGFFFDRSEY